MYRVGEILLSLFLAPGLLVFKLFCSYLSSNRIFYDIDAAACDTNLGLANKKKNKGCGPKDEIREYEVQKNDLMALYLSISQAV